MKHSVYYCCCHKAGAIINDKAFSGTRKVPRGIDKEVRGRKTFSVDGQWEEQHHMRGRVLLLITYCIVAFTLVGGCWDKVLYLQFCPAVGCINVYSDTWIKMLC